MPLESNEHEDNASHAGQRESHEERGETESQMPPAVLPSHPPKPPSGEDTPGKEPNNRRENTKLCLEVVGLLVLIVYTVFSALQWLQIRYTNQLTARALDGSDKTLSLTLGKMQAQIDTANAQYGQSIAQTTQETTIAKNSGLQSKAGRDAADATKNAVRIADESLHMSQRAYLITGVPVDNLDMKMSNVPIYNVGHIPSGQVDVVIHELTAKQDGTHDTTMNDVIEKHWQHSAYRSVPASPAGSVYGIEVHFPDSTKENLLDGTQRIILAVVINYNDGFPDSPVQRWTFCDSSQYTAVTKVFTMRPCEDPEAIIKTLVSIDGYPDKKYEITK